MQMSSEATATDARATHRREMGLDVIKGSAKYL
jgi:hypothetical protein